jgi:hypothetical protein
MLMKLTSDLERYSLDSLLENFDLGDQEHDALQDAIDLRELVKAGIEDKGLNMEKFFKVGFKKVEDI